MKTRILSVVATIVAFAGANAANPLEDYANKLMKTDGLKASYTIAEASGTLSKFDVTLSKPNLAKLDLPDKVVTADGEKITVFIKSSKKYYTKDQSPAELNKLFADQEVRMWAPFFDAKAFDFSTAKQLADANRNGVDYKVVKAVLDASKGTTLTFFIDKKDALARKATVEFSNSKKFRSIDVKSLTLSDKIASTAFNFKAPANSEEIKESDLVSSTWYTNYDEALAVAKSSGRNVLLDFYATWCGPCKLLEANVFTTAEFKALSSKLVFCRIDVDIDKDIAANFKIEAMPTTIIVNAEGSEMGRFVGYVPKDEYLGHVNGMLGN